jgi:hypothetical protein
VSFIIKYPGKFSHGIVSMPFLVVRYALPRPRP